MPILLISVQFVVFMPFMPVPVKTNVNERRRLCNKETRHAVPMLEFSYCIMY